MADENQKDAGSPADSGRARRAPPTIELEASEVTTAPRPETGESTTEPAGDKAPYEEATKQPSMSAPVSPSVSRPVSPWVIAPFSGAVGAALVIGVGWMLGWPQVTSQVAPEAAAPPAAPAVNASVVDDLSSRVAGIEARISKPVAPSVDPALTQRADGLEKSLASLRGELANLRTQSGQLAAVVNDLKSAPREAGGAVDLSGINDRIAQLEGTVRAQGSEIAQEGEKIAGIKAPDDLPLRRAMEASLLDVALRHGDPYSAMLAAAKALAPDPDALKPLDHFAATGLPSPPMLGRELLNLVPKLSPAPPEPAKTGPGIIERLQAGAAKLVRIERTDAVGNDRAAVVTRATVAALHNDIAEARRELNTLSPADRAPAQAWLDKMDARDAALAASRQFADQAMAGLAKPGQ
jgi:hypothetical protein